MPIQELNAQEFSKSLAQQAMEYAPEDINEEQRNYIAKKVYEFCMTTADYLLKQYKEQFTDEQAAVTIQFIGEWTFHKSIDVIRASIEDKYWDQILQQIAFAALKSALQAHTEGYDQTKTAAFIEIQVKGAYEECIKQLVEAKVVQEDQVNEILSQSNVDKMAEEQGGRVAGSPEEEEKTLKYVTIAMVLKKLPQQKVNSILEKLDETEREKITSCLQIENLEQKIDPTVMNRYVAELKNNISSISKPSNNDIIKSLKILQAKYGEEEIIDLTIFERSKIQKFISDCLFENTVKTDLSPYIAKIVYIYIKNKLAA